MATPARRHGRRTLPPSADRHSGGRPGPGDRGRRVRRRLRWPGAGAARAGRRHPATPHATAARRARPARRRSLSRMTEAQRVGQLFLVGLAADQLDPATAAAIRSDHFGSVLFGTTSSRRGGRYPRRHRAPCSRWRPRRTTAGVRFFVAANQEGGQVQQLQGTGFAGHPRRAGSGAGRAQHPAAAGRGLGPGAPAGRRQPDLAPVMDVVPPGTDQQNAPIGALQREFGHDPGTVAAHGVAFLRGMAQAGVATTAKHFPGLGRVRGNTDFSSGVVDTVTTRARPLPAVLPGGHQRGRAVRHGLAGHLYADRPAAPRGVLRAGDAAPCCGSRCTSGRHRLRRHGRGHGGGRGLPGGPGDRLPEPRAAT